jgi:glycosyltransferase involved in cell wall biosynthesis
VAEAYRPLRIWHVNVARGASTVDGITVAIGELSAHQRRLGHDVTVMTDVPGQLVGADGELPDVVHLHSVFRPAHALLAGRLRRAGIPYVTSPHSGLAPGGLHRQWARKRLYIALAERRLLTGAAAVLCLTATEAQEARAVAGHNVRCAVVPNIAPAILSTTTRWAPTSGRPKLVCLSRFDVWQKGLDKLAAVAAQVPDVDVCVYGEQDGNQPARTEQLRSLAPTNFYLRPPVRTAEKQRILSEAVLYVQLSRWEGLSMSVIEAMAHGTPCAVSSYIARSMGLADNCSVLTLSSTPADAAAQIRAALEDPRTLQSMAHRARAHAAATYDGPTVAAQSVAAYLAVLPSVHRT